MNPVQIHLALNHLPVIGTIFGLATLILAKYRKSDDLMQFAHTIFIATAIMTIPVFSTGEPAEEVVEKISGVSREYIEAHEESATVALILALVTGSGSALTIYLKGKYSRLEVLAERIVMAFALAATFFMMRTAHLGGLIRHSELTGFLLR